MARNWKRMKKRISRSAKLRLKARTAIRTARKTATRKTTKTRASRPVSKAVMLWPLSRRLRDVTPIAVEIEKEAVVEIAAAGVRAEDVRADTREDEGIRVDAGSRHR